MLKSAGLSDMSDRFSVGPTEIPNLSDRLSDRIFEDDIDRISVFADNVGDLKFLGVPDHQGLSIEFRCLFSLAPSALAELKDDYKSRPLLNENTSNIIFAHQKINSICYRTSSTNTEIFENSFFIKTTSEWNKLEYSRFQPPLWIASRSGPRDLTTRTHTPYVTHKPQKRPCDTHFSWSDQDQSSSSTRILGVVLCTVHGFKWECPWDTLETYFSGNESPPVGRGPNWCLEKNIGAVQI